MKVEIQEISPIKKKLLFEVPEAEYQTELNKAYDKLKKKVQIKGFRKGKVPRNVLEKYYGARTSMETVSELVDKNYRKAIAEHQIPAVGMPDVQDLKMDAGQPVTFSAEVEVQPKIIAKHFEKIKLKKKKIEVSAEEIEQELKQIQRSQAQWVPVAEGQEAAAGHQVTINFEGKLDGVVFEGGSGQNVPVTLGSNQFLPDFETGLLGAKSGESREFEVKFPENYGAAHLQNKTAVFSAEILSIKQEELPELDDELAKDLGKHESLAALKEEVEARLSDAKEKQERGELFKQVLDHLISKNKFELPESMVSRELDYMWNTVTQQLKQQNMSPEQVGIDEKDYREKNREEAIRRIKGFLLFDNIAEQNELKVEESELEAKLEEIAKNYNQPVDVVKKFYQEQNMIRPLFNQILEEKTLNFVLDKAKIKES